MFFGSFWHAFGYINSPSNLENTLKQENLTVEQLLDTENIVNEIKQSQSKFIAFLKKNSHFTKQIIDYAIQMPDVEGNDEKKLYKYPFVSSEILGTQIKGLEEILFDYNDNESQKDESEEEEEVDEEKSDQDRSSSPQKTDEETAVEKQEEDSDNVAEKTDETQKTNDEETAQEDSEKAAQEEGESEQKEETSSNKQASPQGKKTDSENQKTSEKKYSGKDLLNQLLNFINTEESLNDTSAGYFIKAINNVLTPNGQFYNFIADRPEVLEQLIRHIRTKSISEIVLKLITTVGTEKDTDNFTEQRKNLLVLMNKKFLEGDSFERENISYIIHEIISTFIQGDSQYRVIKCFPSVQTYILEDSFIETFFKVIVNENSDSPSIGYAASILSVLVTFYNSKIKQKNNRNSSHQSEDDEEVNCVDDDNKQLAFPAEKIFEQYIPSLITFITGKPQSEESHTTSYGAQIIPFGIGKLKVVDLITHIFKSENKNLISMLATNGIFKIAMDLMIAYPWNNLLHVLIEKIILESIYISFNGSNETVQTELFGTSFNLLDFIADSSEKELSRPGKLTKEIRQGYIGFLTSFARKIQSLTNSPSLNTIKEANEKWNKYIEGKYKVITDRENINLGGDNPKNKKDEEIDDPNKFEIDIQKIYEKFNNYFRSNKKEDTPSENKEDDQVGEEIHEDADINNRDSSDEEHNNSSHSHDQSSDGEPIDTSDGYISDEKLPKSPEITSKQLQEEEVQSEFLAHQYWRVSNQHNIEELMEDL